MTQAPPKHLEKHGRQLWRDITNDYEVTDAEGLAFLRLACESMDLLRKAEVQIAREGMTLPDRYGAMKPHPLLATVRDAKISMMHALRRLKLGSE